MGILIYFSPVFPRNKQGLGGRKYCCYCCVFWYLLVELEKIFVIWPFEIEWIIVEFAARLHGHEYEESMIDNGGN